MGPDQHARFVESALLGETSLGVKTEYSNLLLCALPKSASLYTTQFLAHCFGLKNHQIGFDRSGGRIYYPRLLGAKFRGAGTISHCHAAPDRATLRMIEVLDLQPLVLTRDLRDALVSRRTMLTRDGYTGGMLSRQAMQRYQAADDVDKLHTVISLYGPEYLNFLAGWEDRRGQGERPPVFLTYEDVTADDVNTVRRIGRELGLEATEDRIREVRETIQRLGGINLTRGGPGRGAEAFLPEHEERLRDLAERLGCEAALGLQTT